MKSSTRARRGVRYASIMVGALLSELLVGAAAYAGPPALYSVSSRDPLLRTIDPATGATLDLVPIQLAGELVERGNGLATHPVTGVLWAVVELDGQDARELVIIDPCTGIATSIGNTDPNGNINLAGLAFNADGSILYGVSGESGNSDPDETLFEVSQVNALLTQLCTLGNGDDGETIAFNPDDGTLYHASGLGTVIFETVDSTVPAACTVTNIDITGTALEDDEVRALTYDAANGVFLWKQGGSGDALFTVTPAGVPTFVGNMDHTSKGLAFAPACADGACCLVTGLCVDGDEFDCILLGGDYQGDDTTCPPLGGVICPLFFLDCNENMVPDDEDIAMGTSLDLNGDGIPDECLVCPDVDVVFVMDTSGSMEDEAIALCLATGPVQSTLATLGINANVTLLGITEDRDDEPAFFCLTENVLDVFGGDVPGNGACGPIVPGGNNDESWAPAAAIVANEFGWTPGAVRLIITISDEGPCLGDPCEDPGADRDAITNAISVAGANNVIVSTIAASGSDQCTIDLAAALAAGTNGLSFESTDPNLDLADLVFQAIIGACEAVVAPDDERAHPGWNWVDNGITLTANEPTYWSALTGLPKGLSPFTVLDPGDPPGRPAMDGTDDRVLRGYVIGWAVDQFGNEIRWNHLKGEGTIVNYDDEYAWEYNTWNHAVVSGVANGEPLAEPGVLRLDGNEYSRSFDELLLNFQAAGSDGFSSPLVAGFAVASDTDLTLFPPGADLRQNNDGPITTKASVDIWNENETKFSGTHRCITCWDQTLLSRYDVPNSFLYPFLQTDHGKARIDGHAADVCDVLDDPDTPEDESVTSIFSPLLGVYARLIRINGDLTAASGSNLIGLGVDDTAVIEYDVTGGGGGPPEGQWPEDPDELIDMLTRRATAKAKASIDWSRSAASVGDPIELMGPTQDRVSGTEKGSLVFFSKVEIRWSRAGALLQDTFLSLTNDYPKDVQVQLYFINGDAPLPAAAP